MDLKRLWLRWVAANALGELLGLGLTLLVGALYFLYSGDPRGALAVLLAFAVAVASGAIEATVVGLAQAWAMRPWFPGVRRAAWWRGTLVGALLAYVLGYLPSTVIDLTEAAAPAGAAAVAEPPQVVVLLLAAGLGLVGGAVLSFAQWRVLKNADIRGAGLWIPANMLAWAGGMPVIFWGIDAAQRGQALWQSVLVMAGALLAAGALVGAVHGAFLVRIARRNPAIANR
jgi:hypothetical protein